MHRSPATHKKLSIAIVAPTLGILGGQSVQARRLLDAWRDDPDIDAWLVPVNPQPWRWLRPATRVKFVRTLITQLFYMPRLPRELRRADVVHVFSASYFSFLLAPLPAIVTARLLGRPVLVNYHSGEAPDHLRRSALARAVLRNADRNVVPSRFLQQVFAGHAIDADVIPNIIDRERFAFRRRQPLRPRLLSTRNFEPLYNVACTLRAFAIVQRHRPDATLTLVGTGSQEHDLRQLAETLGLKGVVFAGRVPPDEIWRYYADADIYVQSPDIDNAPLSVMEAFASGLPVVSTDAGGVPALLTDRVHGLLVPVGDDEQLADRVLMLLKDPILAERVATAAHATTEALGWDRVRDQWMAAYRASLGYPGGSASTVRPT